MKKLSVYIPVHNEEDHLGDCLNTLDFADEVVVLLDKCSDRSKAIAEAKGAKIIEGSWDKEGDRRNVAIDHCSGDWILEIDADERVPPELADEIRQTIENTDYDLHCIWFDNYVGDKNIRWGWGAYMGVMQKMILFRKGAKTYDTTRVRHAKPIIDGELGPVLEHWMIHYVDDSLTDTINRFNSYCTQRAQELVEQGTEETFGRNFRRIFSRFYKCYILRKGYRSGELGFLIAMLAGLYPMVSYLKAKYRLF